LFIEAVLPQPVPGVVEESLKMKFRNTSVRRRIMYFHVFDSQNQDKDWDSVVFFAESYP